MGLLLAIAAAAWSWAGAGSRIGRHQELEACPVPETLYTVKRGDLEITVVENGYLKAKNSVDHHAQVQAPWARSPG